MKLAFAKSVLDHPSLVLNRSWVAIHVTTARRPLCLVYSEAAVCVEPDSLQTFEFDAWVVWNRSPSDLWIRAPEVTIAAPEVIQLRPYNKVPACVAPFTRRNLYDRDGHTFQHYGARCGSDRLSIDHVTPRSKGGRTTWDNCVLACVGCNSNKGDRSIREAGLRLLRKPKPPRWSPNLNLRRSEHPNSWVKFTTPSGSRAAKN